MHRTEAQADINQYRDMLFSIAYNMLGTVADAEDMVQETYASWFSTEKEHVRNLKFYLIRTISNKCLTHLKKIKREREAYIGTWLPEPLVSHSNDNENEHKANLSLGFMYMLEKLKPIERGIIILKEAFDLKYADIAEVFGISVENCRQHLSRAKTKLAQGETKFKVDNNEHEEILRKFLDASLNKNIDGILNLLREDVAAYGDGGGKAPAILDPLTGRENVLRLLAGGTPKSIPYQRMEILSVNGQSCAGFYYASENKIPDILIAIDIDDKKRIASIYYISNPFKLQNINGVNL